MPLPVIAWYGYAHSGTAFCCKPVCHIQCSFNTIRQLWILFNTKHHHCSISTFCQIYRFACIYNFFNIVYQWYSILDECIGIWSLCTDTYITLTTDKICREYNGGVRECVFLLSGLSAIVTKLLEKSLGSRTKYVYACIPPIIGAITVAVSCTNDSPGYVCITHYYFVATLLLVIDNWSMIRSSWRSFYNLFVLDYILILPFCYFHNNCLYCTGCCLLLYLLPHDPAG